MRILLKSINKCLEIENQRWTQFQILFILKWLFWEESVFSVVVIIKTKFPPDIRHPEWIRTYLKWDFYSIYFTICDLGYFER